MKLSRHDDPALSGGYGHYRQWAGDGPNATAYWDTAGRIARNSDELDLLLRPFFQRILRRHLRPEDPGGPERIEEIAAEELRQLPELEDRS